MAVLDNTPEGYPHFFLQILEVPSIFLQILGIPSFIFAIQGRGQFFLHLQIYQFLQIEVDPIQAWSYPVWSRLFSRDSVESTELIPI